MKFMTSSLLHYPIIINFRRIIRRNNYIIIIFPEYDKSLDHKSVSGHL